MKTRMAVLYKLGQPLVIKELEIPQLKAGQVLVRVHFSGICGSQLAEVEGKMGPDKYIPHSLGHEGSGVVADIGDEVTKVKIGDHVIVSWIKGGGFNCQSICYYSGDEKINAGFANTFTEYSIVSENRLVPILKEMPLDKASIIGCAIATGFGSVINDAKVTPGSDVLIIGTGGVSFSAIQAASLVNASKIIVLGRSDEKLEKARSLGATHVFGLLNPHTEAAIRNITNGKGVDFAFETIGESLTMGLAIKLTNKDGGKVVMAGIPRYGDSITVDAKDFWGKRSIIGTIGGSSNPDVEFPRYVDLYLSGRLKLDNIITHRFKLSEINEALELLKTGGKIGRAILEL